MAKSSGEEEDSAERRLLSLNAEYAALSEHMDEMGDDVRDRMAAIESSVFGLFDELAEAEREALALAFASFGRMIYAFRIEPSLSARAE